MKVVHLNTSDFGGAAMAAIQLHEGLLQAEVGSDLLTLNKTRNDVPRHHKVDPFALGGNAQLNKLAYKFRRGLEVSGVVDDKHNAPDNKNLQDRPPGFEVFTLPYSFFNILEHPLVQAADVIHLHWVSYGMIDHGHFFRNCTKPVVWTMHDMNPFTGGCHHADDCIGYTGECPVCPQLKDAGKAHHYWTYKQGGLSEVGAERLQLVAPSKWLAQRATESTLFTGRSCTVVSNGFNVKHFSFDPQAREKLGLPADKKVILFNALDVDNPRKGMQYLLPALERLREQNVMLVRVGGRSGALLEGMTVQDAGFISSPELLALYYSAADLFVLPSLAENLPNTISESLLCGTPVVAFNVGGIPEQIHAGNGILVEQRSSDALEAAIHVALSLNWDRLTIAQQAAQRYDRSVVVQEYQRIYEQAR